MNSTEDNRELKDLTLSTDDLLDQSIIIDKALMKLNASVIGILTLIYILCSVVTKNIEGSQIILMSIYVALVLPGVKALIGKVKNIKGSRKRKNALKNGIYEDTISESEEETRILLIEKSKYYSKYLKNGK